MTGIPGSSLIVGWPTGVQPVRRPALDASAHRQSRSQSPADCPDPKRKSKKDQRFGNMLASGYARLRARRARVAAAGALASAAGG